MITTSEKILAALSYVYILFLIPLIFARKSGFAQAHAKQGLILFAVGFVAGFLYWIPVLGWAAALVMFGLAVYGAAQALAGKYWELPYLGQYAKKINF